jgi:hypothetical protein
MWHTRETTWREAARVAVMGVLIAAGGWEVANSQQSTGAVRTGKSLPPIASPMLFNTPEADAVVAAMQVFPPDNPWNTDVSDWPVHPRSDAIIESIGRDKPLRCNSDMNYVIVPPRQPKVDVRLVDYPDESDPVPNNVPIEGWPKGYTVDHSTPAPSLADSQRDAANEGGDRHAIVIDPYAGRLYEFYQMKRTDAGWQAACAAIFDLTSNKLRPDGWTSADAAGLPIFPAVIRYDELKSGMVQHAMRVTVRNTRREYVAPATHFASRRTDANLPRMGERIRLKADFDISGFSPEVQPILKGLKRYGMLVADNGIEWALSSVPDDRIPSLHEELRRVKGAAFEVVEIPRK